MKWKKKCNPDQKECNCSECKTYQDKAFELEVDEELNQERLSKWWQKYHWFVYIGVAVILLATAGIEVYHSHQKQVRLAESDAFEKATLLMNEGKNTEAIQAFQDLTKSAKTGYRALALINLGDLYMGANQKEEALKTWRLLLETTSKKDPLYLATSLTYVGYQLETEKPAELLQILEPTLQNKAFQGLATELAVLLLKKQGQTVQAEELIQKALQNPALSVNIRARLNALRGE